MSDPAVPPGQQAIMTCIFENLTDDEMRDMFVDGMIGEEDEAAAGAAVNRAASNCG